MSEDEVAEAVAEGEVITIWAVAEDWPPRRGKKAGGSARESEGGSERKSEARSESKSESKAKTAGVPDPNSKVKIPTLAAKTAARMVHPPELESKSGSKSKSKAAGEGARRSTETRGLTSKQLGEVAEAEFIAKAVGLGFVVAKPWGDSEPYDFIVNVRKEFNFWRVQVKSAHTVGEDGTCSFRAHDHWQRSYAAEDIDALVAYARPSEAWYVFPVRVVEGMKSLKLYPGSRKRRSRYEKWREAWEILRKVVRRARRK